MIRIETSQANLQAALSLAKNDFYIFPARPNKSPYIKDWPSSGSRDESVIREWWHNFPDAIPGLPCGANGIFVIDCDIREDINGVEAWQQIAARMALDYSACPIIATPSGGQHIYFTQGSGPPLKNSSSKLARGIDTRGDGGYIIAPGATLPDGRTYMWTTGNLACIPAISEDLRDLLLNEPQHIPQPAAPTPDADQRQYALTALHKEAQNIHSAASGTRNDALNKAAFQVGSIIPLGGITRYEAETALTNAAKLSGLGEAEIAATLKSGIDSGLKNPRQRIAFDWLDPLPLPSGLLSVDSFDPSILPHTIRPWVEDIATRMQCPLDYIAIPAFIAMGATIGCQIAIRPKQKDNWSVTPNLWGGVIGNPGVMKSPAMSEALKPLKRLQAKAYEANEADMKKHQLALYEYELRKTATPGV